MTPFKTAVMKPSDPGEEKRENEEHLWVSNLAQKSIFAQVKPPARPPLWGAPPPQGSRPGHRGRLPPRASGAPGGL